MTLFRDTGLVFHRYFMQVLRNPAWLIIGLVQPILYLVLFAPLLKPVSAAFGVPPDHAYNWFVPGLLVQLGLFGASGVGFGLIAELRQGVIERMRVTPVSRFALLLGRGLRDITIIAIQSTLLVLCSIPFGLQLDLGGVLVVLALLCLIGMLTGSLSYAVALAVKSEDAFAPIVFTVTLPLLLLSGVLLSMDLAPGWLKNVASANPLKYAVDAARDAFNQHVGDASVFRGIVVMGVLCVVAVVIAARSFGRAVS
jgi:ABC-2 type transport system permease protein